MSKKSCTFAASNKKEMEKKTPYTITKCKFFYTKNYHDTNGRTIRSEAYDNESDECYSTTDYFYDKQGNLVRETQDVNNEREHSHTEVCHRDEGECHIIESVTRYANPKDGQRDEKRIEVYHGWRFAARIYDLETGALVSDELWDGEHCIRDHSYPLA